MGILHKTRGDSPINGKQLIFIHSASADKELRDKLADIILETKDGANYAVLYYDGDKKPDFNSPELSRINLYVPVITKKYLKLCGKDFSMAELKQRGTAVLPVLENVELTAEFNSRFKNIHAITFTMKNLALEVEKQLSRMLISSELIEEIIRDGFTRRLFLSYRKKDAAEVDRIMKAVHNTRWANAAAIWFDDFLEPGTDFEDGIGQAMKESDAVLFAVTNNLPKPNDEGKPNYVCSTEYPEALRLGKKLIALEAKPTPKDKLREALGEDFPDSVPIDDGEQMNSAFDALGGKEAEADPYVKYLRAMAYLLGVRVEKDAKKAVKMLLNCVEKDVTEAMMQLSYMYSVGEAVEYDLKKAIEMRNKAFYSAMKRPASFEKIEYLSEIAMGKGGYGAVPVGESNNDCDKCYTELIDEINRFTEEKESSEYSEEVDLFLADAYIHLGNIEPRSSAEIQEKEYNFFDEKLKKAKEILDKRTYQENKKEYYRIMSELCSVFCSFYRAKEIYSTAFDYSKEAVKYQQKLVDEFEPSYEARWSLVTYKANNIGCELLYDKEKKNIYTVEARDMHKCVIGLEALYAEKKDPVLALEIVNAYENKAFMEKNYKRSKAYRARTKKRLKELRRDFPDYKELENKEKDLASHFDGERMFNLLKLPLSLVQLVLVIILVGFAFKSWDFGVIFPWIIAVICGAFTIYAASFKHGKRVLFSLLWIVGVSLLYWVILMLTGFDNPIVNGIVFLVTALVSVVI